MNKTISNILKLEDISFFILSAYWFSSLGISWWWFFGFLLVPDISMIGYLVNSKTGAFTYNLAHNYITATIVYFAGIYFGNIAFQATGIILFAHVAMDRSLNFGLKHSDSFNHTHLGFIKKS